MRQSTLRAARELLAAMTACEQCRQGVQRTAVLVASLLAPAPPPSGGGLDLDLELDTEEGWSDSQHGSDGAWSDSDGEEGGAARRGLGASRPWPSQERLGEEGGGGGEGASSVLSLRFYDPQAEQAFSHWYNCFMLKASARSFYAFRAPEALARFWRQRSPCPLPPPALRLGPRRWTPSGTPSASSLSCTSCTCRAPPSRWTPSRAAPWR